MPTELVWRTDRGDVAGVTIHAPDADLDRVRLVIGPRMVLRLPRIEARLLAQALIEAADAPPPIPPATGPAPAGLYHDPD